MRSRSNSVVLSAGAALAVLVGAGTASARQAIRTDGAPHYVPAAAPYAGATPDGSAPAGTGLRSQQSTRADMRPGSETGSGTVRHLIGPGLPSVEANQSIRDVGTPVFQVAGFQGYVSAPVAAAYDANNNYSTFAGQPGRGSTAVLQQGMFGTP